MDGYIPGKGILVGTYSEQDLDAGKDRRDVAEMQEKTGLKYTNTMVIKDSGIPVGLRVWICTAEDCKVLPLNKF